jgi:hypothetical protein
MQHRVMQQFEASMESIVSSLNVRSSRRSYLGRGWPRSPFAVLIVARFDATSGSALPDLIAPDGHTLVNPQFMAFSVPELSSLMMFLSAVVSLGLWKFVRGRRR